MSITKAIEIAKVEVVNTWIIQVASDIVISENNAEISRSRHRTVLLPYITTGNSDDTWTHTATDISGEEASVQAIANAVWTDAVKEAYKTWYEAQEVI